MRGKYEHQRLKNQNLDNKISDKVLFGTDLNKHLIMRVYAAFSPSKNIKLKWHC